MTLYEKIIKIYPELVSKDFEPTPFGNGYVSLFNRGQGDFIAKWNHPTLPKPTQEQLDAIKE